MFDSNANGTDGWTWSHGNVQPHYLPALRLALHAYNSTEDKVLPVDGLAAAAQDQQRLQRHQQTQEEGGVRRRSWKATCTGN